MTTGRTLTLERSRWSRLWWVAALVALVAVAGWYVTHPAGLGSGAAVRATSKVGTPVYVAALAGSPDRAVDIRSVEAEVGGDADVRALVCRGGSARSTADARAFCAGLEPAEGAEVTAADSLLLRITPTGPGTVRVDRLRVDFRDGLQWGSSDVATDISVEAR